VLTPRTHAIPGWDGRALEHGAGLDIEAHQIHLIHQPGHRLMSQENAGVAMPGRKAEHSIQATLGKAAR